jgi:hypothetical protein
MYPVTDIYGTGLPFAGTEEGEFTKIPFLDQ